MRPDRLSPSKLVPRGAGRMVALLVMVTVLAVTALAVLIGRQLEDKLRADALDSAEQAGEVFASLTFDADKFERGRLRSQDAFGDIKDSIEANDSVIAVRLYTSPTEVIYASRRELDRNVDPVDEVRRAFAGETTSEVTTFDAESVRSEDTAVHGGPEVLEVNLPIRAPGRVDPSLVATLYLPYAQTRSAIASQIHQTRLLIAGVALLLLMVAIPLTVRGVRSLAGGRRHVGFQRELRRALARDELVLRYQPQVDLRTGEVVGCEALVRWEHPEHGLLSPDRFIPQAEETNLIEPLTMRVFDMAMAQVAQWRSQSIDLPPVAVNLSPAALGDSDLPAKLAALLQRHAVSANDVVIEMTESSMAVNADVSQGILSQLDHLGFQLSLDDFGTGYSSLARLDQLPLSELKIDRSFVARIDEGGSVSLVMTMIDLAHDLGMRVVGEGVENEAVTDVLAQSGCDIVQGFHYARPMPADKLSRWLKGWVATPRFPATSAPSPSPSARA